MLAASRVVFIFQRDALTIALEMVTVSQIRMAIGIALVEMNGKVPGVPLWWK